MKPLHVLYLHVVLILLFTQLHILHMLDVGDLLLQLLYLVYQLPVL